MGVTIQEVALHAGVSVTTVSRVLNNSQQVKEKTKIKVLHIIQELGYHPNATAKSLRNKKTMTLGILVPDINVFIFSEFIKGIERAAQSQNYNVIICDADNNMVKEHEYLALLKNQTVDAFVLVFPTISDDLIKEYANEGYRMAVIGRIIDCHNIPCCVTNNVEFSKEIIMHFAKQGHTDIAFISGGQHSNDSIDRLEGYIQGLKLSQLPFQPELIEDGAFNEKKGYEAFKRIYNKNRNISAVYAANDEMAIGVYKACQELGLRIPDDIAVIGVDDNRMCKYVTPPLSSVKQPNTEMGYLVTQMFINQLNEELIKERVIIKASQIFYRDSSNKLIASY
ncbi:LacI family DNA-binding transcriptional regulator [Paenibacillus sp. PL2-23]|uniref:LacI family DNA-binding transcriptional regulator n=1 Tax=Paenibacillus sp. PL2-23 TaxID=2100729 RepID=UPI0030FBBBEF